MGEEEGLLCKEKGKGKGKAITEPGALVDLVSGTKTQGKRVMVMPRAQPKIPAGCNMN